LFALRSIIRAWSPAAFAFVNEFDGLAVLRPLLAAHPLRTLRNLEALAEINIAIPCELYADINDAVESGSDEERSAAALILSNGTREQCSASSFE
jgi:hypothetical protein